MILKGPLGFNGQELENIFHFSTPKADINNNIFGKPESTNLSRSNSNSSESNLHSKLPEPESDRDRAALKLQKVYKSFRTRRQLADCAVLAEQRWLVLLLCTPSHSRLFRYFQKSPSEEEEEDIAGKNKDLLFRSNPSDANLVPQNSETERFGISSQETFNAESNGHRPLSRLSRRVGSKIARLEIPRRDNVSAIFGEEADSPSSHFQTPISFSDDGYETAEESFIGEEEFMVVKSNLFVNTDREGEDENRVPKEKIIKRIDSHKGMKSYQLANQLSSKWTTGAGPRIGCMRDYPSELQFRILERQNLSPSSETHAVSPQITSLSRFIQTL